MIEPQHSPPCRDNTGAPVTKVYFDSEFRSSGSHTDLRWNIPGGQTLRTSEKAWVSITDFQAPHSFYNLQTGVNSLFLFATKGLAHPHPITYHNLEVAEGNYTLTTICAALQTLLNTVGQGNGATYLVTALTSQARVTITESNGGGFMIPSNVWLVFNQWNGQLLKNPPTLGKLLSIPDPHDQQMTSDGFTVTWISGVVHLLRLTSLYIRIAEIASSTIDCGGRRGVARRIPITS